MSADDLMHWVRAVPFRPFRVRLNSGRTFDVRHPEMLKVGRTTMHYYTYAADPVDPYEKMEMIGLLLVESIEPIETAKAAG